MRTPKGFAKNYFSLSAICAYSSGSTLHSLCTSIVQSSRNFLHVENDEDEPPTDLELLELESVLTNQKPCHCNCYFKKLFYILRQIFKIHPQTFFIFNKTRSGVSPPTFF